MHVRILRNGRYTNAYSLSLHSTVLDQAQFIYFSSIAVPIPGAYFGQGAGGILLHKLNCNGTEANIGFCKKDALGYNNCSHTTDAGLMCLRKYNGNIIMILHV